MASLRFPYVPFVVLIAAFAALSGCGGGSSTLTPAATHNPATAKSPTPRATASQPGATQSPSSATTLSPAAVATALAGVQTLFAGLPHHNVESDLQMLATQMVSSGAFKTAVVNPGGITGILPDGTTAVIFADKPEDVEPSASVAAASRSKAGALVRSDLPLSSTNAHEIAFLVNETDTKAFTPARQAAYAGAFTARGFTNTNGYGVDELDATLDDIAALAGRGIDFLDIATHGSVAGLGPEYFYAWLSDTPVNTANQTKYAAAIANGSLQYGTYISLVTTRYVPAATYSFTPQFVASTLTFNQGALVDNQSCFGENSQTLSGLKTTLSAAGVGRYFGWTLAVGGTDADGTDGFLLDRLLGEQTPATGLAAYAPQQSVAQQPFALDDVYPVLNSEMRNSPFQQPPPGYSYTQSPSTSSQYALFNGFFNNNGTANPPLEYGMPSIDQLNVTESPSAPTMEIDGEFPPMQGTAAITDGGGTHPLTVTSWTTTAIDVAIAGSGSGSGGDVQVVSATGVGSNTVPLTKWSGTLTGTENAAWTSMGSGTGNGSGTIGSSFTIDFRADVHPTVPSVDASPVPQNLAFTNVEGDSTAQVTSVSGSFQTSDGMHSATLGISGNVAALSPGTPPLSNSFYLSAIPAQPSTCNNAMPGPQAGPTNVFCPGLGFKSIGAGTCMDDAGTLCSSATWNVSGTIGATTAANDGMLVFTMNPTTYAITVSSTSPNIPAELFEATPQLTGGVTGTINAPVDPPTVTVAAANASSVKLRASGAARKLR